MSDDKVPMVSLNLDLGDGLSVRVNHYGAQIDAHIRGKTCGLEVRRYPGDPRRHEFFTVSYSPSSETAMILFVDRQQLEQLRGAIDDALADEAAKATP